jgi:hypothetical protein
MPSIPGTDFSYSGEEGIYFINPPYCFDIYQVGPGDQFFVKYRFSYGDYSIDTSLLSNQRVMTSPNPNQSLGEKFSDLDYLTVTSNTISFWGPIITNPIRYGTRFVNRTTGHVRFMQLDSLFQYGHYEGFPVDYATKSSGDNFVYTKDAIEVVEIMKTLTREQHKALSKFKGFNRLDGLKEDDNPVLVLFKVKDF